MRHGDEGSSSGNKKKLFYTTSDMMTTMNKALSDMDSPDDDGMNPRVELQRRMPDGKTRRADEKDLEAADMDSKLKQVLHRTMNCVSFWDNTPFFFFLTDYCPPIPLLYYIGCERSRPFDSKEKDRMGSPSAKRGQCSVQGGRVSGGIGCILDVSRCQVK